MVLIARAMPLLTCLALLLSGCQMSSRGVRWTKAQQKMLRSEGFVETSRGWEFSMSDRLLFAIDDSTIRPEQVPIIQRIGSRLLAVDLRRAAIEGHADNTGSAAYNHDLSQRRADAVAATLKAGGFPAAGLTSIGLGERYPVDTNNTPEGRQENRRVVILITAP